CAILSVGGTGGTLAVKRREFIALLGGMSATWPLTARAQQAKTATIGLLGTGSAAAQSQWTAAFVQRLRELGWVEGRNLAIEYRWAEGYTERLRDLANELVRLKVDVIVSHNTPGPPRSKAGDIDDSDRVRDGGRSGRQRHRRQSCAPGRQRHRAVEPDARCFRQAPRTPARDRPGFAPIGGPGRYR